MRNLGDWATNQIWDWIRSVRFEKDKSNMMSITPDVQPLVGALGAALVEFERLVSHSIGATGSAVHLYSLGGALRA